MKESTRTTECRQLLRQYTKAWYVTDDPEEQSWWASCIRWELKVLGE